MGFFDRFKGGRSKAKDEDVKDVDVQEEESTGEKPKKKKSKGLFGLFNRNKGDESIIDSMGLNEAVASMGLSILEDVVDSNDSSSSAVRELEDGYTVVVLTEEMLQDLDIDTQSADFGSFSNAIASEHIETLLLENDLHNGVLAIIPDRDTLDILEEYSFLDDVVYRWGLIPFDIDDESSVVLLENGASLGDLNYIADNGVELVIMDGKILTEDQAADLGSEVDEDLSIEGVQDDLEAEADPFAEALDEDDPFGDLDDMDEDDPFGASGDVFGGVLDDDFDDIEDNVEDEPSDLPYDIVDLETDDDLDAFDEELDSDLEYPEDDFLEDDLEDFDDDFLDDDLEDDLDNLEEDDDYDELDDLVDLDDDAEDYDFQSVEEGQEMIQRVLDREFNNDELGLSLKGDAFNQQFGDVHIIQFDDNPTDDSSLALTISEMRRDANTRLKATHNENIQKLRGHYQNALADIHDKLIEVLDYNSSETPFGQRHEVIQEDRDDKEDIADQMIRQKRDELDHNYDERREDFGNRAKEEALSRFDDQNKDEHEQNKQKLSEEVLTEIKLEFDDAMADLYSERKNLAARIFDKSMTGLLMELQDIHEQNVIQEQEMYEQFHNEIDKFTRDHYTDEVLRAKALDTQQRQHHEAENVRAEYEQLLQTKQRELEQARREADANLEHLEKSHSKVVQDTISEYKQKIAKRDRRIDDLHDDARMLQNKIVNVGEEKEQEFAKQIRTSEDTIVSQRKQIEYEQERADKQGRQSAFYLVGMVIVGIALGLISGFVIGVKRSEPVHQAPADTTPEYSTIHLVDDVTETSLNEAITATFNQVFSADETLIR